MLEQATKKLRDEIEKNKDNLAIQAVGNFLIDHIRRNPADGEKIMAEKKTIKGAMETMKNKARKKAKDGYAAIAPEEGFKIVMEYYGIQGAQPVSAPAVKNHQLPPMPMKQPEPVKPSDTFDINLDDLL